MLVNDISYPAATMSKGTNASAFRFWFSEAQYIVGLLQSIGRCTPGIGAAIDTLCTFITGIISKIDEMKTVRSAIRDLVRDALQIGRRVHELLKTYPEMGVSEGNIISGLEWLFRPMKFVLYYVNAHVGQRGVRRFLGSTSEAKKVEQLRQDLNRGMHYFMIEISSQLYRNVIEMRGEMASMKNKMDSVVQMLQTVLERQSYGGLPLQRRIAHDVARPSCRERLRIEFDSANSGADNEDVETRAERFASKRSSDDDTSAFMQTQEVGHWTSQTLQSQTTRFETLVVGLENANIAVGGSQLEGLVDFESQLSQESCNTRKGRFFVAIADFFALPV